MDDRTQKSGNPGDISHHNALTTEDDNITTADLARGPEKADAASRTAKSAGEATTGNGALDDGSTPALLSPEQSGPLRSAWDGVQASFVDEPRQAVTKADHLVADTIKRLAESFAAERARLEHQWDRGEDVSTEDLRLALQHYRSFFQRLLSV